jgi:predicted DNA binding CopG/RHH family protein
MVIASRKRAKRKSAKKRNVTAPKLSLRMKRLTLDLSESLHRTIKKDAAEEGVTMAKKLRLLLLKHYGLNE